MVSSNLVLLVLLSKKLVSLGLELEEALLVLGSVEFGRSGVVVDPLSQGGLDTK